MSTAFQRQPSLVVVASYRHETIIYSGSIYEFIQKIIDEGWTGRAEFTVNQGRDFKGLRIDLREKQVDRKVASG